jgi:hypothetical protein
MTQDIVQEVLDDEHDIKKALLFKKILKIAASTTVILIFIVIGINVWSSRNVAYIEKNSDILFHSLGVLKEDSDDASNDALKYLIENDTSHVKDVALLISVNSLLSNDKFAEVLNVIDQALNEKKYLLLTENYLKMLWISIVMDYPELQGDKGNKLFTYFDAFDDEKTPFFGSVSILKALYYQNSDSDKSLKIANELLHSEFVSKIVQNEAKAIITNIKSQESN